MMLNRIVDAPINLYYDVTPIGRIQKKFHGDLDAVEHRLYDHGVHILHIVFDIFWLLV